MSIILVILALLNLGLNIANLILIRKNYKLSKQILKTKQDEISKFFNKTNF